MLSFLLKKATSTEIYTLSLHDALPISGHELAEAHGARLGAAGSRQPRFHDRLREPDVGRHAEALVEDRKSTRLNSSHSQISYAVFCLKKKTRMTEKASCPTGSIGDR